MHPNTNLQNNCRVIKCCVLERKHFWC